MLCISIVIPVYNVSAWIEACLLSVCNQTYRNIECIIVNDATPDNSMEIVDAVLREYCGPINFKIISHERNLGLSAARNSGVENATGDYLFFLDSDDELYSDDCMELLNSYVTKYGKADFFIADYEPIGTRYYPLPDIDELKGLDIFYSYIQGKWPGMACVKFIKYSFFVDNSMFFKVGLLHEDLLFSFRLAFYASSMVVIHHEVYKYYLREGSIVSSQRYKNHLDCLFIASENHKLISKSDLNQILVGEYFISILFSTVFSFLSNDTLSISEKRYLFGRAYYLLKEWKISILPLCWKRWVQFIYLKLVRFYFMWVKNRRIHQK